MNLNVVVDISDNASEDYSWDEDLVEDGETYFVCLGTCNRVMHYEDTNGEGMCGRCEDEDFKANYESSDEEEEFHDKVNIEEKEEEINDSSDEEEEFPPIPEPIKRQNTQWIVDGQVVFNGNPNGDRLLSDPQKEISAPEMINK
jgi:hypothetical protein